MSIDILPVDKVVVDSELAHQWDEQVKQVHNLYAMYQAREWILCSGMDSSTESVVLTVQSSAVPDQTMIVPVAFETTLLRFQLSRRYQLAFKIPCVEVLGSQAVGAVTYRSYVELVESLWHRYPHIRGIFFKSVPNDSDLWRMLAENKWRVGSSDVYMLDGERPFHYLALASTFEGYLAEFRKKQRYNLKRQVRVMSEAHDNSLIVECVTHNGDVPRLVDAVRKIADKSWKATELKRAAPEIVSQPAVLERIAEGGLLRAYLLNVKGQPRAYVIGYLFNGVYHYANIGYDSELSDYSPGNVLLLLVIQDLIEKAGARYMNFGITDAEYKRVFGNRHIVDAGLLILRPGLGNSLKRVTHWLFQNVKAKIKTLLSRRNSVAETIEEK
jgi:hypothetical protein